MDDPGPDGTQPHPDDIVRRVQATLTVIWRDRAEAIEQEACEILGVKDLRKYFRKPSLFFADHLKRYSKSRRQAPIIYWPLSTASRSYTHTKVFLEELLELRSEFERAAGLPYKPNLNDGVLITASPLWKLFRLTKWRKDLEDCWKELEAGDYDWAHLAYSIWPHRVREVCKRDRSIAIAHGLEELCEVQKPTKKKRSRKQKEEVEEPVLEDEE